MSKVRMTAMREILEGQIGLAEPELVVEETKGRIPKPLRLRDMHSGIHEAAGKAKDTVKDPWGRSEEVDRHVRHTVPVDVLVYTPREIEERLAINDMFVKEILEKGKVLYERRK